MTLPELGAKDEDLGQGGGNLLRQEKRRRNQEDILKIVQLIVDKKFDPCIIFAFSKRECENLATKLTNLDLTTDDEKKLIGTIFGHAVDCLSEEDRRLPQLQRILPLLRQGIGVHHSGLLPILKEVVEVLFQEGLLKCLFATETFSTGLNMPAKTVVFVKPRKYDGGGFRWLSSGEYIQMSGRAGRRGLDDKGVVILMLDSKMEPAVARQMVQGSAGEWNDSRFARAPEQLADFFPLAFLCACAGRRPFGICLPLELQHDLESVQNRERGPGSSHEVVLQAAPNRAGLALSETEGPKTQGRARVHPNFRFGPGDARI